MAKDWLENVFENFGDNPESKYNKMSEKEKKDSEKVLTEVKNEVGKKMEKTDLNEFDKILKKFGLPPNTARTKDKEKKIREMQISLLVDGLSFADNISILAVGVGAILGEGSDFVFAPVQYLWLREMLGKTEGSKKYKIYGVVEELLPIPFVDTIPICTIAWHSKWYGTQGIDFKM